MHWRKAIPPRDGWLRLVVSPSSFTLLVALFLTLYAKTKVALDLSGVGFLPFAVIRATALDVLVYAGFAALFALGEARSPQIRAATWPLAALLAAIAITNSLYLGITGEQLSWSAVSTGFDRFGDTWSIATETLGNAGWIWIALAFALAVGTPFALRWHLGRRGWSWDPMGHGRQRAHCVGVVAIVGALIAIVSPSPDSLALQQLGDNAALQTYWTWINAPDPPPADGSAARFAGYPVPRIVSTGEIDRFRETVDRRNVLLVILESTRYDATTLDGPPGERRANTPNLRTLAARGASATQARAVLPHTTKSVFSMLCGRLPLMQVAMLEISADLRLQCVPEVLTNAGYRTALLQSALGTFEHRPRFADKLGFGHFEGWEDIQGERLGYLASDDESLAAPFDQWLARVVAEGDPFFATLLTSAPHHPYRLSAVARARAVELQQPTGDAWHRYQRLLEAEDALLGAVLDSLKRHGVAESTYVIVVGDHGEGFGGKGIRQHDNNFYDEGLRVPLVFAGPGIEPRQIDVNVSLADVAPTLLGLLGVEIDPDARPLLAGRDIFSDPISDRTLYFGCWFGGRCRGFVRGSHKVVFVPERSRAWSFDLAADPDERVVRPLPEELRQLMPELNRVIESHRAPDWQIILGPCRRYGQWHCEPGGDCTHPNAVPLTF